MKSPRVLLAAAAFAVLLVLVVSRRERLGTGDAHRGPVTGEVNARHESQTGDGAPAHATPPSAAFPAGEGKVCFEVSIWTMQAPNPAPLAPGETFASRQVRAIGQVKRGSLPELAGLQQGQRILLPVRLGAPVPGVVNLIQHDEQGWVRVGGSLEDGAKGSFSLSQKGAEWHGIIRHAAAGTAYVLETEPQGTQRLVEKPLGSVQCAAIPRRRPSGGAAETVAASGTAATTTAPAPVAVPSLDSLPASAFVIYLDFDGETVTDPDWNGGNSILAVPTKLGSADITAAAMTEVWKRVSEDFKPFNIAVTTIRSRYDNAAVGRRMRCIVTSTDVAEPGAGGVAYVGSFDEAGTTFSNTIPCWAFTETYYSPDDIAGTISHEVGHTLGLSHDGKYPDSDSRHVEYYSGHGSGATSWGPIMGTTYDRAVSQWSKGEYANPSNTEDDLTIIGNAANGFLVRTDEAANGSPGTALPNTGSINQPGIITSKDDLDFYAFSTPGGTVTVDAVSAAVGPNLDILLELREADGVTVRKSSNPTGPAKATLTDTVGAGTFFIVVRSSGFGTADTGYTTYGSIGEYTLTGTFPAVPDVAPIITTPPLSQAVPLGAKVTFTVAATSNTPPTYQWTKDNVNLTGQTKNTLVITSVQISSQGDYRCVVTNSIGSTTSDPATLTANFKPVFTLQPVAKTTAAGTPVSFTVAANGTPTVTFQWQRNMVNVPGATNATLTLNSPQWADAGSYRCVATNAFGSTTSGAATLTVTSAPVILVQPPVAQLVPLNGSASFALTAAGTGTLTYQWFQGATKLTGKTSRILTLTGITAGTAGNYHCEVKNAIGTTVSNDCAVTVQDPPVITRDLVPITAARGKTVTFSVVAVGRPTLKYEWFKNGAKIAGTAASLPVVASAEADYQVVVSNTSGSVNSATVHLTVHDVPKITVQPLAQTKALGGSVTFTVTATGTAPLTHQWKKNGVAIAGAPDSASLILTGLTAADAALYSCTVSNDVGSATSIGARLTLQTAPSITLQPVSTAVDAFGSVTFTATATGTATLKYQWQKFNTGTSAYEDIPLATATTFKIASVQTTDATDYRIKVTNTVGTALSNPATLTVNSVVAPTVTGFTPTIGKAGHYVRVLGTSLNWTTGVNFRNSLGAAVKAAFVIVSANELLVTVPTGAASSAIEVATRGGAADTGSFFNVTTVNDTSDNFADARVIPGAGGTATGNNSSFSSETGEPRHALPTDYDPSFYSDYDPKYSAWFQWTPTVSGSYYVGTGGSGFDTRVAVYTGTAVGALTEVGSNDDLDFDAGIYISRAYIVATAGTTYFIAVDGFNYFDSFGEYDERGGYSLKITKIASATLLATSEKRDAWKTEGEGAQTGGGGEVQIHPAGSGPALALLGGSVLADAGVTRAHATLSYDAPAGTSDQLGFVAYSARQEPIFGLNIAAQSGELTALDAAGHVSATGQTLVPGKTYELDFEIDPAARRWGAILNGVWICRDQPLPDDAQFADFAAQCVPADSSTARATLTVHRADISSEREAP